MKNHPSLSVSLFAAVLLLFAVSGAAAEDAPDLTPTALRKPPVTPGTPVTPKTASGSSSETGAAGTASATAGSDSGESAVSGSSGAGFSAAAPIAPPSVVDVVSPVTFLGMKLSEAYESFGVPDAVFPLRGEEPWQDDVVFFYREPRLYLFWFRDRVWQVRFDEEAQGSPLGLHPGMSEREAAGILGKPIAEDGDSSIFSLPSVSYPVRARLFFSGGALSDLYIYRGDF